MGTGRTGNDYIYYRPQSQTQHMIQLPLMSIERKSENLPDYVPPKFSSRIKGKLLYRPVSRLMAERILDNAQIEVPQNFWIDFVNGIDSGYTPMVITNHSSHADAAASSAFLKQLRYMANRALPLDQQITGFTIPLAASLPSGLQGDYLRDVYNGAIDVFRQAGFHPNLIVREKDQIPKEQNGYGMKDNKREYLKTHKEQAEMGIIGTLIYPEGTTRSGQLNENGLPIGMVPFEDQSISVHMRLANKHTNKKVMIIYAAITGSEKAIDTNNRKISSKAMSAILHPDQFKIRAGGIILQDDPEFAALKTNLEINNYLGAKIASILPEQMRGVYALPHDDESGAGI